MNSPFRTIDEILETTPDLPSISAAALVVMREADSPTSSARSVAEQISQDPALAARVLRLANSAFYGLPRQVCDIQEAVVVLGMRTVRHLAIVASTYTWLSKPLKGYGLGPKELWSHSFSVAVGAQMISKESSKADVDQAFTAGLLHNVGKVVLSAWLQDRFVPILKAAEFESMPFDEIERKTLGFDHAETGARLAERWNLPEPIVAAIRFHHTADNASSHQGIVDCVHVADCLASTLGIGIGPDAMRYETSQAAWMRLGMDYSGSDHILESLDEHHRKYAQILDGFDHTARAA